MKKKILKEAVYWLIQIVVVAVVIYFANYIVDNIKNISFEEECEKRLGKLETVPSIYTLEDTQFNGMIYVCRGTSWVKLDSEIIWMPKTKITTKD